MVPGARDPGHGQSGRWRSRASRLRGLLGILGGRLGGVGTRRRVVVVFSVLALKGVICRRWSLLVPRSFGYACYSAFRVR